MSRPTTLVIEPSALLHNLAKIRRYAPNQQIIAMVKANAYGCGITVVAPILDGQVDALGVSCLEEALTIRTLGVKTPCLLMQGVFSQNEIEVVALNQMSCVIHQAQQLQWIINTPLAHPLKVWVKVNTGMHRLGFKPCEVQDVLNALLNCSWIHKDIGLMTHMACADQPERVENKSQIDLFNRIDCSGFSVKSMANSAAIISFPEAHADVLRPGIMLYGVSPFANQSATDLGLIPVMRFTSAIGAIHHNPPNAYVGYGGAWCSPNPSVIGVVSVGYGDGYPRHIAPGTPVWIAGKEVPIVGRVSMDMITIDLTGHSSVEIGAPVELWGVHLPIERIAKAAGTIGYELLCQMTDRPRKN